MINNCNETSGNDNGEMFRADPSELWDRYSSYCQQRHIKNPLSHNGFFKELQKTFKKPQKKRVSQNDSTRKNYYIGIRLIYV